MTVTLSWAAAMGRLCKHISEMVEESGALGYGDLAWLQALARFRGFPNSEDTKRVALMFDDSGLAGVLLGEEHFPALEARKIESIRLVGDAGPWPCKFVSKEPEEPFYKNELWMGCPSYPKNWRH